MQAEVTILTRRGAAIMRRAHRVDSEPIRFGRGTDNEVPLPDIRVGLTAAALYQRANGLFIEQLGDAPLRVNGQVASSAQLRAGDEVMIGPYRIVVGEPPEGCDAAFSVELVQPIGDALQRIVGGSQLRLEQTHLNKRRLAWAFGVVVLLLTVAAPIGAYLVGGRATSPTAIPPGNGAASAFRVSWNPGQLSNQHRYFAQQCGTCHQGAFARVKDAACLTCHRDVGSHIAPHLGVLSGRGLKAVRARLAGTRCAACHQEHRGLSGLVIRENALCITCHRTLADKAPKADVRDVSGFPRGHPQFRVTLVADAAKKRLVRVALNSRPKPVDHPNLIFSHAAHLVPEGFPKLNIKPMVCADCHIPDPAGQGFLPITYKGQCQRCHELNFDVTLPWKTVPHGDAAGVETAVEGFYATLALSGKIPPPSAPPPPGIERRLPDTPPATPPAQPKTAQAWVKLKTRQALAVIFDKKRGCFYCHLADPAKGPFRVKPVLMLSDFLPEARFTHAAHRPLACADCHAARQAKTSGEVLIPGIQRCETCHGSQTAAFKAKSTCTSCHVFHQKNFGPMRKVAERE